jgi:hypothetical protein
VIQQTISVGHPAQLVLSTNPADAGGTPAVVIDFPGQGELAVLFTADPDNTDVIYLGGSTVTADESATGGFQLAAGQSVPYSFAGRERVYGITTSTQKLVVLVGVATAFA